MTKDQVIELIYNDLIPFLEKHPNEIVKPKEEIFLLGSEEILDHTLCVTFRTEKYASLCISNLSSISFFGVVMPMKFYEEPKPQKESVLTLNFATLDHLSKFDNSFLLDAQKVSECSFVGEVTLKLSFLVPDEDQAIRLASKFAFLKDAL